MIRRTLLPPPLNLDEIGRLTELARRVVDSIDSGIDPAGQVVEFNTRTAQQFTAADFLAAAGSTDLRTFVQLALIPPVAKRKQLTKEELLELIDALMNDEGTEYETSFWLALLERNVPHPEVTNLIYWPKREMTAQEILAEALAYQPLATPPAATE